VQILRFKYANCRKRLGARTQSLGQVVSNTEITAQDKAKDGEGLSTEDAWSGGRRLKPGTPMDDKFTGFINI